jgi:hypothetical protein
MKSMFVVMRSLNELSIRSITILIVILLIGLLMAGGAWAVRVAYATIPDSGGVIHACYDTGNGKLRAIDSEAGEVCRTQERPLSWNHTGPQGPQGPQGPRGPSDGYTTTLIPANAKNLDNRQVHVLSLSLPTGNYILSASARIERVQAGTSTVFCDFLVGGGAFYPLYMEELDGADDVETMAMTTGLSLSSDDMVHLRCDGIGDDGTLAVSADLTAIRVGTLTRQ